MLALLSSVAAIIPIFGPIIDGVVSIYKQKTNTEVTKIKLDNAMTVEGMQDSNQLVTLFASDVMVKVCRDIIMVPGSIYCGTIIWDRFMAIRHPELIWGVLSLQGAMEYLPYALLTFFFGSAFLYWKRR
jgi:hypothetical protein